MLCQKKPGLRDLMLAVRKMLLLLQTKSGCLEVFCCKYQTNCSVPANWHKYHNGPRGPIGSALHVPATNCRILSLRTDLPTYVPTYTRLWLDRCVCVQSKVATVCQGNVKWQFAHSGIGVDLHAGLSHNTMNPFDAMRERERERERAKEKTVHLSRLCVYVLYVLVCNGYVCMYVCLCA